MKLPLISLSDYLLKPVFKSFNIARSNGVNLIVVKTCKGLFIVDTECGYDYSKFIKGEV